MTTRELAQLPVVSLDGVGRALVDADEMLSRSPEASEVEATLVALCRAAYDVLLQWEVDTAASEAGAAPREPESWRTPLDELRVQAALAEMELRAAGSERARVADQLVRTVTSR